MPLLGQQPSVASFLSAYAATLPWDANRREDGEDAREDAARREAAAMGKLATSAPREELEAERAATGRTAVCARRKADTDFSDQPPRYDISAIPRILRPYTGRWVSGFAPSIFRAPGAAHSAGARTSALAELVDVMPTLLDLAGVPVPPRCAVLMHSSMACVRYGRHVQMSLPNTSEPLHSSWTLTVNSTSSSSIFDASPQM